MPSFNKKQNYYPHYPYSPIPFIKFYSPKQRKLFPSPFSHSIPSPLWSIQTLWEECHQR